MTKRLDESVSAVSQGEALHRFVHRGSFSRSDMQNELDFQSLSF